MGLVDETCAKNHSERRLTDQAEIAALKAQLHADWQFTDDETAIIRKFKFKNFKKALEYANLAGEMSETQGHHPDISFGWGYCHILYKTHSENGLTRRDFICAAKLDQIMMA